MSYSYTSIYFDDPIVSGRVLDILSPAKVRQDTAIFFVHGGGWRGGARANYHNIMRAFNAEGFVCASTDYRLAGTQLTDQLTDIRHGYDIFASELRRASLPLRIFVIGSSAGAHLAGLLALAEPAACGESLECHGRTLEDTWLVPVGAALSAFTPFFTPWEDIFPHIWTSMEDIVGVPYEQDPARYQLYSPIEHVGPHSPPILLEHAENEYMFPHEHLVRFAEKMSSFGRKVSIKTYTKAEHGFFYDVTRRQQKEAFRDILSFISELPDA